MEKKKYSPRTQLPIVFARKRRLKTRLWTYFFWTTKWLILNLIGAHISVQASTFFAEKTISELALALRTDVNAKNWKQFSVKMLICLLLYINKLAILQLWKTGRKICATVMWYSHEIWQTFLWFPMQSLSFDSYSCLCFIIRFCWGVDTRSMYVQYVQGIQLNVPVSTTFIDIYRQSPIFIYIYEHTNVPDYSAWFLTPYQQPLFVAHLNYNAL